MTVIRFFKKKLGREKSAPMLFERKQAKISTYAGCHKKIFPSYTVTKGR